MTAKGRRRQPENQFEFFPTPPETVASLLQDVELPGGRWIEPCAGTGNIIRAVNSIRSDVQWTICEIDKRFDQFLRPLRTKLPFTDLMPYGDFVHMRWEEPRAEVLIMNPPFSLSGDFIKTAFNRARWVVMLQRTNWIAPARADWLRVYCPDVYPLPKRPSFRPDGSTDATEYSWFVWAPGPRERRIGSIMMLRPPTDNQLDLF